MLKLGAFLLLLAGAANAAEVTAARTLPAGTIITPADLMVVQDQTDTNDYASSLIGLEAKVTIYEGKAIRPAQLTAPRLVDRNQIVKIVYISDSLQIEADGRALSSGAVGDTIRVMNVASKTTVSGIVAQDGSVTIQKN